MSKIIIDGKELDVPPEYTLLQACEAAGAEIPRFCFHERLSIAGNCRMCLVEVKGGPPKPTASCAMAVRDLRPGPKGEPPVVETQSPMAVKARHGVMEFLLINHPLDCPICDQGGECDLQDQAMAYGVDTTRYAENKRAVENKYIGALVKTSMNRCIHCTRCVRFTTEVAGVSEMGATGRGEDMEITSYLEKALTSELQGNVVDLCPVGALTSKPTEFHARPWEYAKTETIDVMDALGSNIRVDSRGREVIRVVPRINEAINEEWISDKTRYACDGLKVQRLDKPFVRVDGKLKPATWGEAFAAIAAKAKGLAPSRIGAIAGDLATAEEMFALKGLMDKLGSANVDCRQDGSKLHPKFGRASYLFNSTIAGIDLADAIMIVGSNPRREAAVLNARIRKRWLKGDCWIGVDRREGRPDLPLCTISAPGADVATHAIGEHPPAKKSKPIVILGAGAFARGDGAAMSALAAEGSARSALSRRAGTASTCCTAPLPGSAASISASCRARAAWTPRPWRRRARVDLLINSRRGRDRHQPGAFVVYIGAHGDKGAHRADVILPGAAYTEKTGIYVNIEGRPQFAERAIFPPGDAREDWAILRALSEAIGRQAAVRLARRAAQGDVRGRAASCQGRPDRGHRRRRARQSRRARRRLGRGAVRLAGRGFLPDQSCGPRLAHDGRMLGPGAGPRHASGGVGR